MRSQEDSNKKMTLILLAMFLLINTPVFTQSVLTFGSGTSMGVLTGADLCANIMNNSGGILYGGGTICGGLVAIEPVVSIEIPDKFGLSQNYPNPFNPVTNIRFRIAETGFVSLKVYDISGGEVAVLVNENLSAGTYNLDFDASQLASSTYFYRLQTNGFTDVKKMILVK